MNKRLIRVLSVLCIIAYIFSVSAFAGEGSSTINGIKVYVSASNSLGKNQTDASGASQTCAVLSVYDSTDTRIDYQIQYSNWGNERAIASSGKTNGYYVYGSGSATINGVTTSGPKKVKAYY